MNFEVKSCPNKSSLVSWEYSSTCLIYTTTIKTYPHRPRHSLKFLPQTCSRSHWTPVFFGSPNLTETLQWILDSLSIPNLWWVIVFVTRKMCSVLWSPIMSQNHKDNSKEPSPVRLPVRFSSWLSGTDFTGSFRNEVKPICFQMVPDNSKKKMQRVMKKKKN